jgi:hypothetical protein
MYRKSNYFCGSKIVRSGRTKSSVRNLFVRLCQTASYKHLLLLIIVELSRAVWDSTISHEFLPHTIFFFQGIEIQVESLQEAGILDLWESNYGSYITHGDRKTVNSLYSLYVILLLYYYTCLMMSKLQYFGSLPLMQGQTNCLETHLKGDPFLPWWPTPMSSPCPVSKLSASRVLWYGRLSNSYTKQVDCRLHVL